MRDAAPRLKVAFVTLGCKVNQYDTATIETRVLREACEVVPFDGGADVYVVNSCTVTDRADAESRRLARRARRLNPRARVVLTGCFAQSGAARAGALTEVDHVVGLGRLDDVLRAVHGELDPVAERVLVHDLRKERAVTTLGAEVFPGQTRAFLKIQEGCDLFCTFCIVPTSRGRSRSVEPRRVLAELQRLGDAGYREVVLTGVHLGGYGRDLEPRVELPDLVAMLAEHANVPRLRLSSLDPPEVTPRLLEVMRSSGAICPHLHMPVQSGSDAVLRRMRRQYDGHLLRDVCAEISRALPGAALGTDVIAGFPGESDADAATTLELLDALPFTHFHVFPYSRRSGTTAAKAVDQIAAPLRTARAAALRALGERKTRAFTAAHVGAPLAVLVEARRDAESGRLAGYSRNYVRVLLDGPDTWMNCEIQVRGSRAAGARLYALAVAAGERDGEGAAALA